MRRPTPSAEGRAMSGPIALGGAGPASAWRPARARGVRRRSPSADEPADNRIPVLAPLVGTFYEAAEPGAKAFAAVGDTVEAGQTVCIVEAMKLMNEVAAGEGGKVAEILVAERRRRSSSSRCSCTSSRPTSRRFRVREGPHRQPRRDRAPGRARVPRAGHQVGRGLLDGRRRVRGGQVRRRGRLHRPARRRARATCTSRTSSGPRRRRAPTRFTRATGSSPRTPSSPRSAPTTASRSSAPSPR